MLSHVVQHVDGILLGSAQPIRGRAFPALAAVLWGGVIYGAVMGTYAGVDHGRWLQILYSAIKVPLLIGATMLLALPGFYVINAVVGVGRDFPDAVKAVLLTQGTVGIVLASLAPMTAVWYLGPVPYHEAITANGIMFLAASVTGQITLRMRYRELIARNRRHLAMYRFWLFLYGFVAIQMAWVLRPFVGDPQLRPTFFRDTVFGNAYVVVWNTVWTALGR